MGRWNHLDPTDEQIHRLGPAIFGKFKLGGRQAIVYNAALLFGVTEGLARLQLPDAGRVRVLTCASG